jgi:hypothetical protein
MLVRVLPAPLTSGRLHMRAYMYRPSSVQVNAWFVTMEGRPLEDGTGINKISVDVASSNRAHLVANVASRSAFSAEGRWPAGRWMCVELVIQIGAGTTGQTEVRLNGQTAAALMNVTTSPPGGFRDVMFGVPLQSQSTSAGLEVYFDDLVVDTKPIGCD